MSINRHNYEEYFILYMDNELGQEERRVVEAFVQQHPDLKEELDTLLQYKMTPDTNIVFAGKEELIKQNGHSIITASNYEEWLTLYIDEELTAEQKMLVENYIAANPAVQKDLAFFQKTRLQPETIVFNHKDSLYRREEKVKRISPFWWRAAAAVLLLAFGLTAVLITNKKAGNKNDVAGTTPVKQEEPLKTTVPAPLENNTPVVAEENNSPVVSPLATENDNNGTAPAVTNKVNDQTLANNKKAIDPKNKLPEQKNPLVIKKEEVIADNKPSNNLPQPLNNPNPNSNRINNKPEDAFANNTPEEIKKTNPLTANVTNPTASPSDYIQASNTSTDELEQPDGKKNKNRGLFRKIARTFEKRTNIDPTDDNKLLVAGLSIKLK